MFWTNKPTLTREPRSREEMKAAFESKKINLYVHNFEQDIEGFNLERPVALEFRDKWLKESSYKMPFYGHGNLDGKLTQERTQQEMCSSMFSLISKRRETHGQGVGSSMLLGVPCIFFKQFLYSTFTEYEITKDNSLLVESVDEAIDRIKAMTWPEYKTLSWEAKTSAERFMADEPRRKQLRWFFDRVYSSSKFQAT